MKGKVWSKETYQTDHLKNYFEGMNKKIESSAKEIEQLEQNLVNETEAFD